MSSTKITIGNRDRLGYRVIRKDGEVLGRILFIGGRWVVYSDVVHCVKDNLGEVRSLVARR